MGIWMDKKVKKNLSGFSCKVGGWRWGYVRS